MNSLLQSANIQTMADLSNILNGFKNYMLNKVGGPIIAILGVILFIYGAYAIAKAIWGQQGATAGMWLKGGLAILIGGLFFFGGITKINTISKAGSNTVDSFEKDSNTVLAVPHKAVDQSTNVYHKLAQEPK